MKNEFVADGYRRFLRGKKSSMSMVEKIFAEKITTAAPDERLKLQEQMARECRKVWTAQNHMPSAKSLW